MKTIDAESLARLAGRSRPSAIRRWLDRERIPYLVAADGWPRVSESAIVARMSVTPTIAEPRLRLRNG